MHYASCAQSGLRIKSWKSKPSLSFVFCLGFGLLGELAWPGMHPFTSIPKMLTSQQPSRQPPSPFKVPQCFKASEGLHDLANAIALLFYGTSSMFSPANVWTNLAQERWTYTVPKSLVHAGHDGIAFRTFEMGFCLAAVASEVHKSANDIQTTLVQVIPIVRRRITLLHCLLSRSLHGLWRCWTLGWFSRLFSLAKIMIRPSSHRNPLSTLDGIWTAYSLSWECLGMFWVK